jgi:hypothetical protein
MPAIENPRIEVHLSLQGAPLLVAGIVRQIMNDHRAGIEFIDVSSRKAEQITALFAELIEVQNTIAKPE